MKSDTLRLQTSKSEREAKRNKIVSFIVLLVICVFWLFPFIYVFGMSVRTV